MIKILSNGTGRRKTSVARVYIREGAPGIKVNGRSLEEYFPIEAMRDTIKMPLQTTSNDEKLNILVNVRGGGISGQAGAIRHGIARALVQLDETNRPVSRRVLSGSSQPTRNANQSLHHLAKVSA